MGRYVKVPLLSFPLHLPLQEFSYAQVLSWPEELAEDTLTDGIPKSKSLIGQQMNQNIDWSQMSVQLNPDNDMLIILWSLSIKYIKWLIIYVFHSCTFVNFLAIRCPHTFGRTVYYSALCSYLIWVSGHQFFCLFVFT